MQIKTSKYEDQKEGNSSLRGSKIQLPYVFLSFEFDFDQFFFRQ
jgi:hypothetical protein